MRTEQVELGLRDDLFAFLHLYDGGGTLVHDTKAGERKIDLGAKVLGEMVRTVFGREAHLRGLSADDLPKVKMLPANEAVRALGGRATYDKLTKDALNVDRIYLFELGKGGQRLGITPDGMILNPSAETAKEIVDAA